jgi:S-DNA-T family DNA segregation ATPase FtsK/SpoIIIE
MKYKAGEKAVTKGKGKAGDKGKAVSPPPPPPPPKPRKPLLTNDQRLDLFGLILIGAGFATILIYYSPGGQSTITQYWISFLRNLFGRAMIVWPLVLFAIGIYLLAHRFGDKIPAPQPSQLVGVFLGYGTLLATSQIIEAWWTGLDGWILANDNRGGGVVGWWLLETLRGFGNIGAIIAIIIGWVISIALISSKSVAMIVWGIRQSIVEWNQRRAMRQAMQNQNYDEDDGLQRLNDPRVIVPRYDPSSSVQRTNDAREGQDDMVINRPAPRTPSRKFVDESADALSRSTTRPATAQTQPDRGGVSNVGSANVKGMPPARVIGGDARPVSTTGQTQNPPTRSAPQPQNTSAGNSNPIAMPSAAHAPKRDWLLPQIDKDMLEPGKDVIQSDADIRARARLIEETLASFGVPAKVVETNPGPTITQYGVEPGFVEMKSGKQMKVKVSRIAALADDLALALAAPRIRVQAPVPGTNFVGIEVPNGETALVSLRDVMESEEYQQLKQKTRLAIGLGQDVSGHSVIADLTTMPHMLIAGTTGSGKSVCVNAIITALLINNTPDDLRLLMVDPKRVELTGYNGIPHLISPVVVDIEQVTSLLKWVVSEMERRYRVFAKHGARNMLDFNNKVTEEIRKWREARKQAANNGQPVAQIQLDPELQKMPYIVLIIDELADLMMLAPDETEKTIVRLAQMARATGIHLILATQRPSVDVVTGLIKANFPARIAFTVASAIDSRVILDSPGAEKLLGRGDMLVLKPDQPQPQRAQGCFLSDKEINRVVRHWRGQLGGAVPAEPVIAIQMPLPMQQQSATSATSTTRPISPITPAQPNTSPAVSSSLPAFANETPPWAVPPSQGSEASASGGTSGSGGDSLFDEAVETVRLQGKASISLLQRRLRIGYTRAARIIEEMEERGIVGPQTPGSQFREVLGGDVGSKFE